MLPDSLIRPARDWTLCVVEQESTMLADSGGDLCFSFTYFLHGYSEVVNLCGADHTTARKQLDAALHELTQQGWAMSHYDVTGTIYYEPAVKQKPTRN